MMKLILVLVKTGKRLEKIKSLMGDPSFNLSSKGSLTKLSILLRKKRL